MTGGNYLSEYTRAPIERGIGFDHLDGRAIRKMQDGGWYAWRSATGLVCTAFGYPRAFKSAGAAAKALATPPR